MIKRLLSVLIAALYICYVFVIVAPVSAESAEVADMGNRVMVDYLTDGMVFSADGVTRAEFTAGVIRLAYENIPKASAAIFSDVGLDHPYADEIYMALNMNVISKVEAFNPDDKVTYAQAIRIAMSILGYDSMAKEHGGYPNGYFAYTNEADIHLQKSAEDTLSPHDAMDLLAQIAEGNLLAFDGYGSYNRIYGATILSYVRGIEKVSGIITANQFTSLYSASGAVRNGFAVEGEEYSGVLNENLLGYEADVYYKEDGNARVVCFAIPSNTNTKTISAKECGPIVDGRLMDKENRKYKIDDAYNFIYNGKAYSKGDSAKFFEKANVTLTLIDAGRDGIYETICAEDPFYMQVSRVENGIGGKSLFDNETPKAVIDLRDNSVSYEVYSKGKEGLVKASFEDIAQGSLISYCTSEDKKLIKMVICNDSVKGTLSASSKEKATVTINGVEYHVNDSLGTFWGSVVYGAESTFLLDEYGRVVLNSSSSDNSMYGWIVAAKRNEGLESELKIKMFTEEGEMEIMKMADSVTIDGARVNSSSLSEETFNSLPDEMRLVRFRKNMKEDAEITMLDYPQESVVGEYIYTDKTSDPDNSLIKNRGFERLKLEGTIVGTYDSTYKRTKGIYRANDNCKFFSIPDTEEKRADDKYYKIGKAASGYEYDFAAYDIDVYGNAGALVALTGVGSQVVDSGANCAVVESVIQTLNEDGKQVPAVYVAYNGKIEYYMFDEGLIDLAETLNVGDVIRFNSSQVGYITAMYKDYDFRTNTLNYSNSSILGYAYGHFDTGWIYSANAQSITLIPEGTTTLTANDIRALNYAGSVTYIYVRGNRDSASPVFDIRFEPLQEVNDYVTSGANADSAVVYGSYNNTRQIFIYRFN